MRLPVENFLITPLVKRLGTKMLSQVQKDIPVEKIALDRSQ